jgi:hypothetical protein
MTCNFIWANLPKQIKDNISVDLSYKWNRIPTELNTILRGLEISKPVCYAQYFEPNEKIYWFNLVDNQVEKLCNLIDC